MVLSAGPDGFLTDFSFENMSVSQKIYINFVEAFQEMTCAAFRSVSEKNVEGNEGVSLDVSLVE